MNLFRNEQPTLPKLGKEDKEYFLRELALAAMLEEFVGIPESQGTRTKVSDPTPTTAQPATPES